MQAQGMCDLRTLNSTKRLIVLVGVVRFNLQYTIRVVHGLGLEVSALSITSAILSTYRSLSGLYTTLVNILPYRPPAWLIKAKNIPKKYRK